MRPETQPPPNPRRRSLFALLGLALLLAAQSTACDNPKSKNTDTLETRGDSTQSADGDIDEDGLRACQAVTYGVDNQPHPDSSCIGNVGCRDFDPKHCECTCTTCFDELCLAVLCDTDYMDCWDVVSDEVSPPPPNILWVDNLTGSDAAASTGTELEPLASIGEAVARASSSWTSIHVVATSQDYDGVCVTTPRVTIVGEYGTPTVSGLVVCDGRNALFYSRADDVHFENFELDASSYAGQSARALIFSGLPEAPIHRNSARFIAAVGPGQGAAGRSLISSSLCYDCALEDSSSIGAEEHGIYWTNHQDGSIIRRNIVEDADGACLQLNSDPETYDGGVGIQDGVMSNALVEDNILRNCGTSNGGAALNLAGVKNSVFRNNVIYGSALTGGIANWDDGYSDWGDAGNFAFGCSGNTFVHNTVDCRGCDRHAFSMRNGSTDNTFVNNIVITSTHDAIAIDTESTSGHSIDTNLYLDGTDFEDTAGDWLKLAAWQALGFDTHAVSAQSVDAIFVDAANGDYHLKPGSPAIDAGTLAGVTHDIDQDSRPRGNGADIGADETF